MRVAPLIAVIGLALCGCLQVSHTLSLENDGSGTLEFLYRVPVELVREWEAVYREAEIYGEVVGKSPLAFDEAAVRDAFKDFDPNELALKELHIAEDKGAMEVRMLVQFHSLEALASANLIDPRSVSLQPSPEETVTLLMRVGDAQFQPMAPIDRASDFSLLLQLELPGDIHETNGQQTGPRSVRWRAQGLHGEQGLLAMSRVAPRVVFRNQGLHIPPFGQQHIRLPGIAPSAEIP